MLKNIEQNSNSPISRVIFPLFLMEKEHICRFCSKSFPCGRSLGGHMRSHLINAPPPGHPRNGEKPPKKTLPPLSMDQSCHENPNQKKRSKDGSNLVQDKACKECGKSFHSWKALFGHMKCHSANNGRLVVDDQDSWNISKQVMDSQSDNEAATTPPCKRKRSDRIIKRYNNTSMITNSSSSLTIATTEISGDDDDDHHKQEVALSLIILSRDKGDWGAMEPSITENLELDSKSIGVQCFKKLKKQSHPRIEAKTRKLESLNAEIEVGCDEFEVNSPKKSAQDEFKRERKRERSISSSRDLERNSSLLISSKFRCSICKKAFQSYQALGGHRASQKKFKGCCAPRSNQNSLETENSHSQVGFKKGKEHECPICFKVFWSSQALGGHKRSHLIVDEAKASTPHQTAEIRGFLDLNLPAPAEEEEECSDEFKPWWIAGAGRLGLLSTS